MLSKCQGLFRLTRDLELRYGSSGTPIAKLGLACSEKYKDKENKLFIDATCFGKQAEILNSYANTKGTQIFIVGKLQTEEWVDQNQQKRSKISMIIESFDFVSNKQQGQQPQAQQEQQPQQYRPKPEIVRETIPAPIDDLDSLPF